MFMSGYLLKRDTERQIVERQRDKDQEAQRHTDKDGEKQRKRDRQTDRDRGCVTEEE